MYKHTVFVTVRLSIETEDSLSAEELEELIHEIDYEFSSDYGTVSTLIEDPSFVSMNRIVK